MADAALRAFLFADLRDYTAFAEAHGDRGARDLIRAFRRLVRAEVGKKKGREIKTEGDNFYVVFELPGDAVRCAIGIQKRSRTHNERHPELPLKIGIGINAGEAVRYDSAYVSVAVNVAARLCAQAPAGSIIVSDTVHGLLRTAGIAPMRDLGPRVLKNIAESVHAFEVETTAKPGRAALAPSLSLPALLLPAPSSNAAGLVISPELVQRHDELRVLEAHLKGAANGERQLVAIVGEAGVGKTRIVREIAARAHREGFYVFGGRAHPQGAVPYEAYVAALRPYAHARGVEVLRHLLGPLMPELRRLLPEIATEDEPAAPIPEEERRERFLRAVQLVIEDAAAQRPVLLVLEDLQYADAATRDLLLYLTVNLRAGVCTLFTYRDEELPLTHPLRASIAELERGRLLTTLRVLPLDRAGVARMTDLLGARLDPDLEQAVYDRSEGIPFYVEELLKTALDRPGAAGERLRLPRSIADSVQLRVTRLTSARGPGAAELLEVLAVAGLPLSYDAIVAVAARDEQEVSADIGAAVDAQLLERPATRSEIYQFRHALTREAVDATIPAVRRRALHRRVAEALERLPQAPGRAAFLASQFLAAGERDRAFAHYQRAATEAAFVGAYGAAVEMLAQAVELAPTEVARQRALEQLALAHRAGGDPSEAERVLRTARRTAPGESAARLDVLLASVLRMQGRRGEALDTVQRAITALEGTPGSALPEAIAMHAELRWAENDASGAAALARRALSFATDEDATGVVVAARTVLGSALSRLGDASGPDELREAIRLAMAHDLVSEAVNAYLELARAELFRSDIDAALTAAETGMSIARDRGLGFAQARLLSVLTTICSNVGRYADARGYAEQALALARSETIAAYEARVSLGLILANQGEYARALALFDQIAAQVERGDPDRRMTLHAYRAQALLGLGSLPAARAAAQAAVDIALANPGMGMVAFLNAADTIEAGRDGAGAVVLLRKFDDYFAGRSTAAIRAARIEIEAIIALLHDKDAAVALDNAAAAWHTLGAQARAMYRRASAALVRIRHRLGTAEAKRALELARAELLSRQAIRYLHLLDAGLPAKRARALPAPAPGFKLTGRELRVAMLLARGYTNQRIAAELRASRAEAESAVARVLAKLGVRTRSQVAAWIVDRQPVEVAARTRVSGRSSSTSAGSAAFASTPGSSRRS